MRKERSLFIIGFWIMALPFLGFPDSWRKILFILTGLILIYIGYLFSFETRARISKKETSTKTFVDNMSQNLE